MTHAFLGEAPLAPDAHLVSFTVGIRHAHFAGKIGSLARLLDWWADRHGVLFMISAGNVPDALTVPNTSFTAFERADPRARRQLVEAALRANRHTRTLMAPAEAMNVLTVGAISEDLTPPRTAPPAGNVTLHAAGDTLPALSSAIGLGAFRSIKPDFITTAGEHELRASATYDGVRLRVIDQTQRTGLHVATVQRGAATTYRTRGTSCATALASRATLFSLAALTASDGPFAQEALSPRDKALLTKAMTVNAARWPETAIERFAQECALDPGRHARAREEVCRYYGHGVLDQLRMREAPPLGATLAGLGTVRKDKAALFQVPLPASLAGQRIGRSICATIAWFSPVRASRARYRLALLEAIAHDYDRLGDLTVDDGWALALKSDQLDANIIKRGTVWSRRLVHNSYVVPGYAAGASLPVRVQCRDGSGGGLSPDDDIRFALAITIEVEAAVHFNVYSEIQDRLRVSVSPTF